MKTKESFLLGAWLFSFLFVAITLNNIINIFWGLDICLLISGNGSALLETRFWISVFSWSLAGFLALVLWMLSMISEEDYVVFNFHYRL